MCSLSELHTEAGEIVLCPVLIINNKSNILSLKNVNKSSAKSFRLS